MDVVFMGKIIWSILIAGLLFFFSIGWVFRKHWWGRLIVYAAVIIAGVLAVAVAAIAAGFVR